MKNKIIVALACLLLPITIGVLAQSDSDDASSQDWALQRSLTTQELLGVYHANGQWVAVGFGGTVLTSDDAVTWRGQQSGTNQNLLAVHYAKNTWVAVGGGGTIITSKDAVTWAPQVSKTENALSDIHFDRGNWVAVGNAGTILASGDAETWNVQKSNAVEWLLAVHYAKRQWVAVGFGGTILTSTDTVVWTNRFNPMSNSPIPLNGIHFANGQWVTVGWDSVILTSRDGVMWGVQEIEPNLALFSLQFSGENWIAVGFRVLLGSDGVTAIAREGIFSTSITSKSWTTGVIRETEQLWDVHYADKTWVGVGRGGAILTLR